MKSSHTLSKGDATARIKLDTTGSGFQGAPQLERYFGDFQSATKKKGKYEGASFVVSPEKSEEENSVESQDEARTPITPTEKVLTGDRLSIYDCTMKCIYEAAKKKLNLGDDPGIRKKEKKSKKD